MNPTEYENHVAALLRAEGWDAHVTPAQRDFGLDIVAEQPSRRLGVQVKMYGNGRPVNAQIVMQLYGAAKYRDCTDVMLATDGRVLDEANMVAQRLGIDVRHVSVPATEAIGQGAGSPSGGRSFDGIWQEQVMPLTGRVLSRSDGSSNEVISVDWSGLKRKSSGGRVEVIDIEIFRWAIERLLAGEVVLREEINAQYPKRASSGITLVLRSLPVFEEVTVGRKQGIQLRVES